MSFKIETRRMKRRSRPVTKPIVKSKQQTVRKRSTDVQLKKVHIKNISTDHLSTTLKLQTENSRLELLNINILLVFTSGMLECERLLTQTNNLKSNNEYKRVDHIKLKGIRSRLLEKRAMLESKIHMKDNIKNLTVTNFECDIKMLTDIQTVQNKLIKRYIQTQANEINTLEKDNSSMLIELEELQLKEEQDKKCIEEKLINTYVEGKDAKKSVLLKSAQMKDVKKYVQLKDLRTLKDITKSTRTKKSVTFKDLKDITKSTRTKKSVTFKDLNDVNKSIQLEKYAPLKDVKTSVPLKDVKASVPLKDVKLSDTYDDILIL